MGFGSFLGSLLKENGKSVYSLSKETGIPKTTIYGMIDRDSTPDLYTMASLVACFGKQEQKKFFSFTDSIEFGDTPSEETHKRNRNDTEALLLLLQLSLRADRKASVLSTAVSIADKIEKNGIVLTPKQQAEVISFAVALASNNQKSNSSTKK